MFKLNVAFIAFSSLQQIQQSDKRLKGEANLFCHWIFHKVTQMVTDLYVTEGSYTCGMLLFRGDTTELTCTFCKSANKQIQSRNYTETEC